MNIVYFLNSVDSLTWKLSSVSSLWDTERIIKYYFDELRLQRVCRDSYLTEAASWDIGLYGFIVMKYIDGQRFVLMLLYERWQDFKCHLHYSLSVVLGDAMKWAVCELTSASFHRVHFITQWFNIFIAWEDYTIIIDVSLLLIHLLYKLFLEELICNLNGKQNHASEENHVKSC